MLLAHTAAVAAAAYGLAALLRRGGAELDPVLAQRGGLLHDIGRPGETRGQPHHLLGADLLVEQSLNRLAGCARGHMLFGPLEGQPPRTLEEKIAYYADKLVEGSLLVPVAERLAALGARYAIPVEKLNAVSAWVGELEAELAALAGLERGGLFPALHAMFRAR